VIYNDLGRYNGPLRAEWGRFQALLQDEAKWAAEGKLKVLIAEVIKLEQVAEALEKLKAGKFTGGKVVVKHI